MKKNKGFTLAELLIVVAIIAILVAISIPIFTTQLEKSRKAVDLTNVRNAKAVAASAYMDTNMTDTITYYYDASSGKVFDLEHARVSIEGYGKSHKPFQKEIDGAIGTPNIETASGIVAVTVGPGGIQGAEWELKGYVKIENQNVNDYVVIDENGNKKLVFEAGKLSYTNITSGSILKAVKDKSKVKEIIFGANNDFQVVDNDKQGNSNQGIDFGRGNDSVFAGYTSLEKIDFSGITIGKLDMNNLNDDKINLKNLKEIVLPNQDGVQFNITGKWYTIDESGNKVYLDKSTETGKADVDSRVQQKDKGKTIYRDLP